jgi:Domain of unknown function (DUF4373)
MKSDTYYFPHDYHARHDLKTKALIIAYGMQGYGVWQVIVEMLHEGQGRIDKFPKLYDSLAIEFRLTESETKKIMSDLVNEFKLLKEDDFSFWSDRVKRNLEERLAKNKSKVEAGKIGGIRSAEARAKFQKPQVLPHKTKATINPLAVEIYDYYATTIKPGAREDSIKNIAKLLESGINHEELKGRINAYKAFLKKGTTETQYIIQANNFFGLKARYKEFDPIKPPPEPTADPSCDICKGKGTIPEGEQKGAACLCMKVRAKK